MDVLSHVKGCGRITTLSDPPGSAGRPWSTVPHGIIYCATTTQWYFNAPGLRGEKKARTPITLEKLKALRVVSQNTAEVFGGGPPARLGKASGMPRTLQAHLLKATVCPLAEREHWRKLYMLEAREFVLAQVGAHPVELLFWATRLNWAHEGGTMSIPVTTLLATVVGQDLVASRTLTLARGVASVTSETVVAQYRHWATRMFEHAAGMWWNLVRDQSKCDHTMLPDMHCEEVRYMQSLVRRNERPQPRAFKGAVRLPPCLTSPPVLHHPARRQLSMTLTTISRASGVPIEALLLEEHLQASLGGQRRDRAAKLERLARGDAAGTKPLFSPTCYSLNQAGAVLQCGERSMDACHKRLHNGAPCRLRLDAKTTVAEMVVGKSLPAASTPQRARRCSTV